jgi:hypothetical protein
MAQDVKARHVLGVEQAEHIARDVLGIIAVIRLVAIRVSAKVRRNEREPVGEPLNDRQEFTVVLRPAMHAQDHRATAGYNVVKIDTICRDPLVRQAGIIGRGLLRRCAFGRGLGKRCAGRGNSRSGDCRPGNRNGATPGQTIVGAFLGSLHRRSS